LATSQTFTLAELALFSGGIAVGAFSRGSIWKHSLACAAPPLVLYVRHNFAELADPIEFLGVFLFVAATVAAGTLFFAVGMIVGQRALQAPTRLKGFLQDAVAPSAIGILLPIGFFTMVRVGFGAPALDGLLPMVAFVLSCLIWGLALGRFGGRALAFVRAAALEVGIVIGLTAWISYPDLPNLGPPLVAYLAIVTCGMTMAGTALAMRWGAK